MSQSPPATPVNAATAVNDRLLLAIILLEGFVTISLEVLTIRQLISVVGSNIIVTSLIIGVFLLFLAYGYRKGGTYSTNLLAILKRNFLFSFNIVGLGLSLVFIEHFFAYCNQYLGGNSLLTLLIYLLVVTAPIAYVLGQTVPITIQLFKQDRHIGAISGKVLHLSTIGSFLGSVLTSLLLMNFLGVAWTVFFNVAILAVLVLSIDREKLTLLIVTIGCAIAYLINVAVEKSLYVVTTPYANYAVYNNVSLNKTQSGKLLMVNNSMSSFIGDNYKGFDYIEYIKKILFQDLNLRHKRILVIGAGGFTLSAEKTNGNHFTYIDVDKAVYTAVRERFVAKVNGKFIVADGRQFVQHTQQAYDVIISDAFNNLHAIPAHLLTQEHFMNLRRALTPDGIAIFNIIAHPLLTDPYSKRVDNTIRSVFPNCMATPLQYTAALSNIIYICKKSNTERDKVSYQDDKNTSMLDAFAR